MIGPLVHVRWIDSPNRIRLAILRTADSTGRRFAALRVAEKLGQTQTHFSHHLPCPEPPGIRYDPVWIMRIFQAEIHCGFP